MNMKSEEFKNLLQSYYFYRVLGNYALTPSYNDLALKDLCLKVLEKHNSIFVSFYNLDIHIETFINTILLFGFTKENITYMIALITEYAVKRNRIDIFNEFLTYTCKINLSHKIENKWLEEEIKEINWYDHYEIFIRKGIITGLCIFYILILISIIFLNC